jgi:hypothetical protein
MFGMPVQPVAQQAEAPSASEEVDVDEAAEDLMHNIFGAMPPPCDAKPADVRRLFAGAEGVHSVFPPPPPGAAEAFGLGRDTPATPSMGRDTPADLGRATPRSPAGAAAGRAMQPTPPASSPAAHPGKRPLSHARSLPMPDTSGRRPESAEEPETATPEAAEPAVRQAEAEDFPTEEASDHMADMDLNLHTIAEGEFDESRCSKSRNCSSATSES